MSLAFQFPDTFAGGVSFCAALAITARGLLELHRCSRGWRR